MSRETVVETKILAILEIRKDEATLEDELRLLSGVKGLSFKEAMIRLVRKHIVTKWKTENYVNYFVLAKFSDKAYYLESVRTHELNAMFGSPSLANVQRSIPFVCLDDGEIGKDKLNRYRVAVA